MGDFRKAAIDCLMNLTESGFADEVRIGAIRGLGAGANVKDNDVVESLMNLTQNNAREVEAAAAEALGQVVGRKQ